METAASKCDSDTCLDEMPGLQQDVQRKLGRCMLRLQQYERALKEVVGSMSLEGPIGQLRTIRAKQQADASTKTLGGLVRMFTDGHLESTPSSTDRNDTSADGPETDVPWARIHFGVSMSPERLEQTKAGLAELVSLRNELVHHLIERFDIHGEHGCRAASIHLDECYAKIDRHYLTIKDWITGIVEARELLVKSKAFKNVIVHGILPDGSVCWPLSTIVECLRNAETACRRDGWTDLNAAIALIAKDHPDQIPSRYGCTTWRQVLKRSALFEVRTSPTPAGEAGKAWYRSCPEGAAARP